MAEGGLEMDEMLGLLDPETSRNPDEEETGFMDNFDEMDEIPSTMPPWAGGAEMPDGLDEGNLASNDYRDRVVARFTAERSKYSRRLSRIHVIGSMSTLETPTKEDTE